MTNYATLDRYNNNDFVLSSGDLVASGNGAYVFGVKTTDPKTSGKFYLEAYYIDVGSTSGIDGFTTRGFGIMAQGSEFRAAAMDFSYFGPANAAILCISGEASNQQNRFVLFGTGSSAVWVNSDTVCMAVNLDDNLIWWRINNGNWNNNVSADPATNVGGLSITTVIKPVVAYLLNDPNITGFSVQLKVDPATFNYSAPAGYGAWIENEYGSNLYVPKLTAQSTLIAPNLAVRKFTADASLLPPNLAVRKLTAYALLRRISDFGPIPIFPTLPVGFPTKVSLVMDTTIGTIKSLREVRVANQTVPLWDIELVFEGLRDATQNQIPYTPFLGFYQYMQLVQTWLMMYGQTNVFAFEAPWDYSRLDQLIAIGDGQSYYFPVIRSWGTGSLTTAQEVGLVHTVTNVKWDGVEIDPSLWFIDRSLIYFVNNLGEIQPPPVGVNVTMTFTFYYLCRFVEDEQDFEEFSKNRWTLSSLKFRAVNWPNTRYVPG